MDDIIKAMRVLAELSNEVHKDLDRLVDESGYEDTCVITSRMAACEMFAYFGEMLEKAAGRLERESDYYGWVEHDGNGQPIPNGICVEVKSSSDLKSVGISESFFWYWNKRPSDIISYRVINP